MLNHKRKVLLLLVMACALCLALTGCIVDPEEPTQPEDTSTWKRYTQIPVTDVPTAEPQYTPAPTSETQSWDATDNTFAQTPTPTIGAATIVPGLTGTATPTLAPGTTESTLLKRGMQGDRVKNVQESLRRLGYFEGKADGDFGEYTENAVKEFQRMNGLTPDGVVGPSTLAKLGSSTAATATPKATNTPRPTATPKPTARKTATPKPTATPKVDNVYLSHGSSGAKVKTMQTRLIELGYLTGSASGKVDDITELAIIAFQKRNSLDADGIAGPGTLEKLYSKSARQASSAVGVIGVTLKLGDDGAAVRTLQTKLKSLGYLTGTVDGSFGSATQEAVKAFQRANGITADGKAGYATLQKLFAGDSASASKAKATATPKANAKATATIQPNTYVRVTAAPDGSYVTLEKGTMGSLVTKLQKALRSAGYFKGNCDGYYGDDTVEAVRRFQRDKGLNPDGKAGPATQRYLYEGNFPKES